MRNRERGGGTNLVQEMVKIYGKIMEAHVAVQT